jgi:transcriptional regulator with PAS, ATPase and Fis domain
MIGQSPPMQRLRVRIARIATTPFTVLIEGESGVGKELVARALHQGSPRSAGPFVPVNCAALVESLLEAELFGIEERAATGVRGRRGKFELADQGTLFLDEVADLSPGAQAKLLRVLQDFFVERVGGVTTRRVDTRVLAATNTSLKSLVDTGKFRPDLYYRLSGVEVTVPPLRDRRTDVPLLVDHFVSRHVRTELPIDEAALDALVAYDWPGNVRQLGRVIERALALASGPVVTVDDLPPDVIRPLSTGPAEFRVLDDTMRAQCTRYARAVLERCQGNKRRACEVLDITYHTLKAYLDYGGSGRSVGGFEEPASSRAGLHEQAS